MSVINADRHDPIVHVTFGTKTPAPPESSGRARPDNPLFIPEIYPSVQNPIWALDTSLRWATHRSGSIVFPMKRLVRHIKLSALSRH